MRGQYRMPHDYVNKLWLLWPIDFHNYFCRPCVLPIKGVEQAHDPRDDPIQTHHEAASGPPPAQEGGGQARQIAAPDVKGNHPSQAAQGAQDGAGGAMIDLIDIVTGIVDALTTAGDAASKKKSFRRTFARVLIAIAIVIAIAAGLARCRQ
jgi:hypothetical protein